MKKKMVKNNWEYEIITEKEYQKKFGNCENGRLDYGYRLRIYKNKSLEYSQGGFGAVSIAEVYARDYFLLFEFNVEREYNN